MKEGASNCGFSLTSRINLRFETADHVLRERAEHVPGIALHSQLGSVIATLSLHRAVMQEGRFLS